MNLNTLFKLLSGLLAVLAYDDLSYGKEAIQEERYISYPYSSANNALDRNITTCARTAIIGNTSPDKNTWWQVDLGGVYSIYNITVMFKEYNGYEARQRGRFAGFSLFVSRTGDIQGSTLCYKDKQQLPPLNFTTVCTVSGRYVIFYNERLDGVTYPIGYEVVNVFTELCEVIVQGCNKANVYGINCDTPCPTNCKDSTCHIQSGACFNCKSGWTGMYCNTRCGEGWYGDNCTEQCVGHCRDNTPCHHVTGQCDGGCDAGWTGATCHTGCDDGTYGYNCVNNCGHCFNGSPCNKQTGHCDSGCNPGYTNSDCNKTCLLGHYGINCGERCSGHCMNNEPCDHISGACSNGCQDGFVGTYCNNSCTKGYFGTNCSRECSPNCKPDTCRHTDGLCTSCGAGWMGHNCTTECALSYGDNCQYPCNVHCIDEKCDKINGSCLYGCEDGKQCEKDTFPDIATFYSTSTANLPVLVGGIVGACLLIVGVGMAVFTIRKNGMCYRQKSCCTLCQTSVHNLCFVSTPVAEENVNSGNLSNYQELNFQLQENPYQCISR